MTPKSLDFSEDGRFPAVVEVVLRSGYKFAAAVSYAEANEIIGILQTWATRDTPEAAVGRGLEDS